MRPCTLFYNTTTPTKTHSIKTFPIMQVKCTINNVVSKKIKNKTTNGSQSVFEPIGRLSLTDEICP